LTVRTLPAQSRCASQSAAYGHGLPETGSAEHHSGKNVAFGLKFRGAPEAEAQQKVKAALELVGLPHFADRKAVTLSGGEMQRVALARAIVTEPEVLLLDEPTANLDPVSSDLIEELILRINKESGTTVIMATHDMTRDSGLRTGSVLSWMGGSFRPV